MNDIAQYCNNCDGIKVFQYIGMQENFGDKKEFPLYNCIECKGTQIDRSKKTIEKVVVEEL